MMENRIIAQYMVKEGICPETGDFEIDLCDFAEIECISIDQAKNLIKNNDVQGNGIGTISEQIENEFGIWDDVTIHHVDDGEIIDTIHYD